VEHQVAWTAVKQSNQHTHSIYVVEDHLILRKTLLKLLEREPDMAVAGEAETAAEALEQVFVVKPDLILVDISLPDTNGIALVEQLRKKQPSLRCLMVSGHEESVYVKEALRVGARGYVMKGDPGAILRAIRHVMDGNIYLSEAMHRQLGM
jgi:DNA-binding NarL/FixJ family response regulator